MAENERPLPEPPHTPFGKRRHSGENEQGPLIADRMVMAMAEGRLDEFLKNTVPDNEYARALSMMMLGMTGMMPGSGRPAEEAGPSEGSTADVAAKPGQEEVPEAVRSAVRSGDVQGLMGLLEQEYKRRSGQSEKGEPAEKRPDNTTGLPQAERETLDHLMRIASENKVTIDWIVLRALRLYVQDYEKTGRL